MLTTIGLKKMLSKKGLVLLDLPCWK